MPEPEGPRPAPTEFTYQDFAVWLLGYMGASQNVTVLAYLVEAVDRWEEQYAIPAWLVDARAAAEDRIDLIEHRPF